MSYKLVEVEEDLQHICIASRKNLRDHALIRLILSTLASYEEITNFTRRDFGVANSIHYVVLRRAGKSRKVPIDRRTYEVLKELSKSSGKKLFDVSKEEIDRIIESYSPPNKKYDYETLVSSVEMILRDFPLYEEGYIERFFEGKNIEWVSDFLKDAHPMFSGMWDLEDEEVAADYFEMLSKRIGSKDAAEISKVSNVSEDFVRKFLE